MGPRFRRPEDPAAERARWRAHERHRPASIAEALPGQESVWDYPRPPRLERLARDVEVRAGEVLVARTREPFRVCETAGPPVYYVPPEAVVAPLVASERESFCEWKGLARYWHVEVAGSLVENVGWSYPRPDEGFEELAGAVAFYPGRIECHVAGERVRPQPGGYYGGWVTDEIVGPFKGEPGSEDW